MNTIKSIILDDIEVSILATLLIKEFMDSDVGVEIIDSVGEEPIIEFFDKVAKLELNQMTYEEQNQHAKSLLAKLFMMIGVHQ